VGRVRDQEIKLSQTLLNFNDYKSKRFLQGDIDLGYKRVLDGQCQTNKM
jgi:hypothetical protein